MLCFPYYYALYYYMFPFMACYFKDYAVIIITFPELLFFPRYYRYCYMQYAASSPPPNALGVMLVQICSIEDKRLNVYSLEKVI